MLSPACSSRHTVEFTAESCIRLSAQSLAPHWLLGPASPCPAGDSPHTRRSSLPQRLEKKAFQETHLIHGFYESKPKFVFPEKCMSDESAQRQRRSLCLSTKDYDDKEKWSRYVKPNMIITTLSILSLVLVIGSTAVVILYVQSQRLFVPCPKRWVKYEEKCYYFSEIDGSWDSSQRNCSSYGASLVSIDTQQEMDFLMRFKGSAYYWIGLQREAVGEPWKWTNGSIFNGWFNVAADGLCAYLDDGVISTWCTTQRHWICHKS